MTRLSYPQIVEVLVKAGWPQDALATATAIVMAESGGVVEAVNTANSNGTYDYGLMQINSIHTTDGRSSSGTGPYDPRLLVSDPIYNAAAGYAIFRSAGFRFTPWAAFNSGAYLKYMADATAAVGGTYVAVPETGVTTDTRDFCNTLPPRKGITAFAVLRPRGGVAVIDKVTAPRHILAQDSGYDWLES